MVCRKGQTCQLLLLVPAEASDQNIPAGNRSLPEGELGREGQVTSVTFPRQPSWLERDTVPSQHPSSPLEKMVRKATKLFGDLPAQTPTSRAE